MEILKADVIVVWFLGRATMGPRAMWLMFATTQAEGLFCDRHLAVTPISVRESFLQMAFFAHAKAWEWTKYVEIDPGFCASPAPKTSAEGGTPSKANKIIWVLEADCYLGGLGAECGGFDIFPWLSKRPAAKTTGKKPSRFWI